MDKYPPLLKTLLEKRGIKTVEEAEDFLNPDYEQDLHDPFLLPDMDKAVGRILQAVEKKERVVIFSDYDADGIPGGVILYDFFQKIGHENFTNYIPHRHDEGFGLNHEAIDQFKKDKVKLIITVDCGITDLVEAEEIKKHKIDLIITDHHLPAQAGLPEAVAVVDAKREDSQYPFKDLCGAGVAYKLVQAILISLKEQKNPLRLTQTNRSEEISVPLGWEKWLLDMVGIATLSDMVPLVGENRALAYYGLKVLRKSPRVGLLKLFSLLKIDQRNITEDDIVFSISPRINAASRMGSPDDAFKLFIAQDEVEADLHARHLDKINNERKGIVASLVKEVRKIMKKRYDDNPLDKAQCKGALEKKVIVIGNPDWKPSLLGLVANSLVDDHNRPVFLWGRDGGNILKGSCRGDGCMSVLDLMQQVEPGILQEFGGHQMSGGFSVIEEKVHLLEEKLQQAYEKVERQGEAFGTPKASPCLVESDLKLILDEVTSANYKLIEKLAPFGTGNPKPLFLFEKVMIEKIKMFGKENNHLELTFKNSQNVNIKAIGFFRDQGELKEGNKINLLANLELSFFAGRKELRLRIVDLTPNPSP